MQTPNIDILLRSAWLLLCMVAPVPGAIAQPDGEGCLRCHEVDAAAFEQSVHGFLGCLDCHEGADQRAHRRGLPPVACSSCHEDVVAALAASAHGGMHRTRLEGIELPTCANCHGEPHAMSAGAAADSPANPQRQAQTCAQCHGREAAGAPEGIRTLRPVEAYEASVHAKAVAEGRGAAACSDCHHAHAARPANDPASAVHRANVPGTCGQCHGDITAAYEQSIHGLAAASGVRDSPVCTDCHGEHRLLAVADAGSPVSATNVPILVCGPCHADLRLSEKYGLPVGQVPTYADSYHGLAARGGVQRVANCASCHGVHNILPSRDPRSLVHADNLAATCGKCHEGAGEAFGIEPVHVVPSATENPVAYWIERIYIPLIWIVIGGMVLHNLVDLIKKTRSSGPPRRRVPAGYRIIERMSLPFRITHAVAAVSFVILVISGFALKYPESAWAAPFRPFAVAGEVRGIVHRAAAIGLLAALGFHLLHLVVSSRARRQIAAFLPGRADLVEIKERIGYNLGLRSSPAAPVRVGYVEKVEYWAALWGTLITAVTGFFLWFENFTLANLPAWVPEAATVLHLYEAILAALAIAVWHFYSVMFDPVVYPMDSAWFTGKPPFERAHERGEAVFEQDSEK